MKNELSKLKLNKTIISNLSLDNSRIIKGGGDTADACESIPMTCQQNECPTDRTYCGPCGGGGGGGGFPTDAPVTCTWT